METKQDITNLTLTPETLALIPNDVWIKIAEQLDADDMSALASTSHAFPFNSQNDAFKKQWIAIKENKDHILCATGSAHTLIYINKTLFVSGYNDYGQLGLGHNDASRYFVECQPALQPRERITQVVAGGFVSYLLTNRNRVLVCGSNLSGELGRGQYGDIDIFSECTIPLNPAESIRLLAAACHHVLLLTDQNRLLVCGSNDFGEIGLGHPLIGKKIGKSYVFVECELNLEPGEKPTMIAAGGSHSLIVTNQNRLLVSGFNKRGQLGLGHANNCYTFTPCPIKLTTDERIITIVAGLEHSLIATSQNRLLVCGNNEYGQLGLDDTENRYSFEECKPTLNRDEQVLSVSAGVNSASSYLITNQNRLLVCGNNENNVLGLQNIEKQMTFTDSKPNMECNETIKFAVGSFSCTLFVTNQKRIFVSGDNEYGQLGIGDKPSHPNFIPLVHNRQNNTLIEQADTVNDEKLVLTHFAPSLKEFIDYISKHFAQHAHLEKAVKVFDLLDYVENNIESVVQCVGIRSLFRHPLTHLAIHLDAYATPDIAKDQLLKILEEVKGCIQSMLSIADEKLKSCVIDAFLLKINNDDRGCMEGRLRPALNAFVLFQSTGVVHINMLMTSWNEVLTKQYNEQKRLFGDTIVASFDDFLKEKAVTTLLDFFSENVESNQLITSLENETVPLNWLMVKEYVQNTLGYDDMDEDWMAFHSTIDYVKHKGVYYFDNKTNAERCLSYLKSLAPPEFKESIAKARVKSLEGQFGFSLRRYQEKYFNQLFQQNKSMPVQNSALIQDKGDWKLLCFRTKDKAIKALNYIAIQLKDSHSDLLDRAKISHLPEYPKTPYRFRLRKEQFDAVGNTVSVMLPDLSKGSWLIKSIRWDTVNYLEEVLLGITKSPANQHKQILRPGPHKQFTVFPTGVFPYAEKPSPYFVSGQTLKDKKAKCSQFQSTSLVTAKLRPPAFGFDKDRRNKLVGFAFSVKKSLINRIFTYDGGTYGRPYEADSLDQAQKYFNKMVNTEHPKLHISLEALEKSALQEKTTTYNEILARIRFVTKSKTGQISAVLLFSDSFEARCIAQYYSRQLIKKLKEQFVANNCPWNDNYQVPIVHYLPGNVRDNMPYSEIEQERDREQAIKLLQNMEERNKKFKQEDYEFLLLIQPEALVTFLVKEHAVIDELIAKKQWHVLEALIDSTNDDKHILELIKNSEQNLSLFDIISTRHHKLAQIVIEKCDPNLNETLSEKKMDCLKSALFGYFEFGLTLLYTAARDGYFQVVKALIEAKVDVNQTNSYGQTPLWVAARNGHYNIVELLLTSGAQVDKASFYNVTPLWAAAFGGWVNIIELLLANKADIDAYKSKSNLVERGTALYVAVQNNHLEAIQVLIKNGADVNAEFYDYSPLLRAVENNLLEATQLLLKNGANVNARLLGGSTCLHLAVDNGNLAMVKLLLDNGVNTNYWRLYYHSTALSLAESKGYTEIVELIRQKELEIHQQKANLQLDDDENPCSNLCQMTFFDSSKKQKEEAIPALNEGKILGVK